VVGFEEVEVVEGEEWERVCECECEGDEGEGVIWFNSTCFFQHPISIPPSSSSSSSSSSAALVKLFSILVDGVLLGVGAELLLGFRPITLIALPKLAAELSERANVGREARRGRGEGGEEEAGRVSRVWSMSGSIGELGVWGVVGEEGMEVEERERCRVCVLDGVRDARGELDQGRRGSVALRWYGTVNGVRTAGRISVAERKVWRVAYIRIHLTFLAAAAETRVRLSSFAERIHSVSNSR
jgi:hypothetical protein